MEEKKNIYGVRSPVEAWPPEFDFGNSSGS